MSAFLIKPGAPADALSVVSLADAKVHLRVVDDTSEDSLITALIGAAVNAVEQYVMRSLTLVPVEWQGDFDQMGRSLGIAGVTAITAISYLASDGTTKTVAPADCRIVRERAIIPAPGKSWPVDVAEGGSAVTLDLVAGYDPTSTTGNHVPPSLISAVKMMLDCLFAQRDGIVTQGLDGNMPAVVMALCRPYRDTVI
jgi:uncharacterized phiE125 gp8 family phage protein